ncbi:MAG: 4Fe-4S ferredoxin [Nitrospira sp. WS238]|nr:4Fe-4S ferredoxin [Nitrospira sp. WS238]
MSCDVCLPPCPNQASFEKRGDAQAGGYHVSQGQGFEGTTYVIPRDRCMECVGHCEEPPCISACPIEECCVSNPVYAESKEILSDRARHLHPHTGIGRRWRGMG